MTEFPLAAKIETPDTDKDAAIPVHPGAAAFVDGEEKTFLDRYSDFIWWGLMALSAMGSVGAWFAGYLKKDERNNNSSLRERLLDMIAAARKSDSTEELDQMQAEADDILRDTLHCFEHGAIEEGALTAFNIALEQFHNAVADRRALLISMPQNLQRARAVPRHRQRLSARRRYCAVTHSSYSFADVRIARHCERSKRHLSLRHVLLVAEPVIGPRRGLVLAMTKQSDEPP